MVAIDGFILNTIVEGKSIQRNKSFYFLKILSQKIVEKQGSLIYSQWRKLV